MNATVQKWGNSLALRIPKTIAVDAGLTRGSVVSIAVKRRRLIVDPDPEPTYTLEELVKGITKKNRHPETDWGPPVGKEIW